MSGVIGVLNLVLLLVLAGCLVRDRRRYRSMIRLLELHVCAHAGLEGDPENGTAWTARPEYDQVLVHQLRARINAERQPLH